MSIIGEKATARSDFPMPNFFTDQYCVGRDPVTFFHSDAIADLGSCERLNSAHVAEAVHYRALDKAYFRVG